MSPHGLLRSNRLKHRIELRWRIAVPVALLVLALLAVPLAYVAPAPGALRQGWRRLAGTFILYLNLLAFTRAKMDDGEIPAVRSTSGGCTCCFCC